MEDDMNALVNDVLANSLEGNALGVQDAVNAMMNARALEALQAMKMDVAQSIYSGEEQSVEEPAEAEVEYEAPAEDDNEFIDSEAEDLFAELDQLTDDESEEDFGDYSEDESEEQYEDDTDV